MINSLIHSLFYLLITAVLAPSRVFASSPVSPAGCFIVNALGSHPDEDVAYISYFDIQISRSRSQ